LVPLTSLLKKEVFCWTQEETKYFEKLKEAMCTNIVLSMLDFKKICIVECDALGHVICVILMQEARPLAFESSHIKGKNLLKSIYDKEMLSILHAIKKWNPYLIERHFKVKKNHDSLKNFLEKGLSLE
jgi:hypothetical protein